MSTFFKITFLFFVFLIFCTTSFSQQELILGSERYSEYFHLIKGKGVGIVANHSSIIKDKHLIDILFDKGIDIKKIFSPEHGFSGIADAGEKINVKKNYQTDIPIISLYGDDKKPSKKDLKEISIMIFDIQDVGVRFYTYLSTLHYVMEACAENNVPLIVLDRPNPNIQLIDGPVLEEDCKSFVGMHPVPIVYGMTIGEYSQMINGEYWLKNKIKCELKVIKIKNYTRNTEYELPIRPSPNLPNQQSIKLYPSLCLFEPTAISIGRGTKNQFQIYGHPDLPKTKFIFCPKSYPGAKNPKYKNICCNGVDLRSYVVQKQIILKWLIHAYENFKDKSNFFNKGFYRIAGNKKLKEQIELGVSENKIRETWKEDLIEFKKIRTKYLLYE